MTQPEQSSASQNPALGRVMLRDLLHEALASVSQNATRALLTVVGTVLGVGVLVAVLGFTRTVQSQVSDSFSLEASRYVSAQLPEKRNLPLDIAEKVAQLPGVEGAGLSWTVIGAGDISAGLRMPEPFTPPTVLAISDRYLTSFGASFRGRSWDDLPYGANGRVCSVGKIAADLLGVTRPGLQTIRVGGRACLVTAIVDSAESKPELLTSIHIPLSAALQDFGLPDSSSRPTISVKVKMGSANVVADQLQNVVDPTRDLQLEVVRPPDLTNLRNQVNDQIGALYLILAVVSLIVGGVGIANTTLMGVVERIPEIGLRRSMGARRWHIALQFLIEASVLGCVGGLIGSALGVLTVLGVSAVREWTAVLPSWLIVIGPLLGLLTGLLAGTYPAVKAARLDPIVALRM